MYAGISAMARSKPFRDWLYLATITTQLLGMLVIDLLPLYPSALWLPPSSPLHPLLSLREAYVAFTADPFFAHDPASPAAPPRPFLHALLWIEGLVQLPLAVYTVRGLASKRPTTGPVELAGLVFACLTAMGSTACVYELLVMGEESLSAEKKTALVWGTYFPFAVIPFIMAVDMYARLLPRVADRKSKTQ